MAPEGRNLLVSGAKIAADKFLLKRLAQEGQLYY
jgi:hypothetical protein